MKLLRKTIVLIIILAVVFTLTACVPAARVRVISSGNEHTALEHWNHGSRQSWFVSTHSTGWHQRAEHVADELDPFSFGDDFQIITSGQLWRNEVNYHFYKLTDGEWISVLAVSVRGDSKQIFLTHGNSWNRTHWAEVHAESFLDLLAPGEYILDVSAWWGNSRARDSYQNFFRFIK